MPGTYHAEHGFPASRSATVPTPDSSFERFFAELKRRRVYRVAAAYLVAGWVVVEVAAETFPYLGLPDWTVRAIIVMVGVGFPIALVLAWVFDVRTTPAADAAEEAAEPPGGLPRRAAAYVGVGIVLAVVVLGAVTLVPRPGTNGPAESPEADATALFNFLRSPAAVGGIPGDGGFVLRELSDAIDAIPARQVILFVDVIHSAGVGRIGEPGVPNSVVQLLAKTDRTDRYFAFFSASELAQLSQGRKWWEGTHGVFAFYLLRGLRGAADEDGDRVVTLGELMDYTRRQVRKLTESAQAPVSALTRFDGSWPLSVVPPGGPDLPPEPEPLSERNR